MTERAHTIEASRDHWLANRSVNGSDWEQALGAVYDLALGSVTEELGLLRGLESGRRSAVSFNLTADSARRLIDQESAILAALDRLRAEGEGAGLPAPGMTTLQEIIRADRGDS